jgi:uncharacterized membrane protein
VPTAGLRTRRAYIDVARGLAVLLMIEAHTIDAWTRQSSRAGRAFAFATMLGGLAAPLFLWLAGLGASFAAGNRARRGDSRTAVVDAVVRRGLEIFILAFLFRLQAFVISPGSHPVTLFRVDILNVMGPAIVATGLVWGLAARGRRRTGLVLAYAGLALACAMTTPLVRTSSSVALAPIWIQWYIRPFGDYTTFTLFPWAGFVFSGAGCGVLIENAREGSAERRTLAALLIAGASVLTVGIVLAGRPTIYAQSSFWTSSPTYFAIRVGLMMIGLSVLAALAPAPGGRMQSVLERFGRSSLFVYWIHVELVYGYATWPLRHRLPLWGTAIAFALFSAVMYWTVVARDHVVEEWRARRRYSVTRVPV